ncbi:D-amino acid dehydrogenase 1 [Variovorax paradoxus]|uniref:D-amino acid dehydrogenase 1 n=1 Tax=Variovorax paradoxus TaxID=34073 RepID=A0A679J830_VARPD|nr:D-amino acid dehydrogenase 1 [Variovorax paradoxus]
MAAVRADAGRFTAERYVVAFGGHSPALVRPLGIGLPVYPLKGFSITVPIADAGGAPESTVMDETFKVAVTRLGDRIRAGGTAQLSDFDLRLDARWRDTLEHVVTDLFPAAATCAMLPFGPACAP